MILPSRMAVLNYATTHDEISVPIVMEGLKKTYGAEKQFNAPLFLEHLMALEANGLLESTHDELDENDHLVMYFKITEDGRNTAKKYIPKEYQAV